MSKKRKKFMVSLITYAVLILLFIVLTVMINNKSISRTLKGQLIPICSWIVMAVSLNLVVGISGELSLGHAGFMGIGAFSGIIVSGWLLNGFQMEDPALRLLIAILAGFTFMLKPTDMGWVLIMLAVRAFGALPITYITMAMLADALDHVEWKAGFRADGFSMSVYTIIFTLCAGLAQGVFNFGLSATGYVPPAADGSWVAQSQSVKNFFVWGYQGIFAAVMVVIFVLMWFYRVEDELPTIRRDITARHRAEAEAMGVEYVSPEELAEREQAENDRIAEANRIKELKAKCEKKGLRFEEEEAKYQQKLAAAKAKAEAKAAKKAKK